MYFSDLQKKLLIEQVSGQIIGYIQDAMINPQTGKIEGYYVSASSKFFQKPADAKLIAVHEISSVGSDFIFVNRTSID